VFGIVKQSGGSIWVYSEQGRGTTFKVYFPSAPADSDIDGESGPATPAPDLGGTETSLLVEDDDRVRVVTRTMLRRFGYSVLEAAGGGDALLLAERHITRIALLLTDVVMPRMSGSDLAERVRAMRPDLKVLYMSGYTDNVIMQQGELDPGEAFIQKPITPDALARKVRAVLDSRARMRGGR
jgi:CheY-like chemotaxis protein